MHILLEIYFTLQCLSKFLLYRLRGMSDQERDTDLQSTQLARLIFWGLPFAVDSLPISYLLGITGIENVSLMFFLCLGSGWLAAIIRHSSWQSPSYHNYFIMGLITTGMLTIMLVPLIIHTSSIVKAVPFGMLGWLACILSYNGPWRNSTLKLFGITFCVPGDSSWEEFFIGGLAFGVPILLIGFKILGII